MSTLQYPVYTVDYFIEKFESIPYHLWCEEDLNGKDGTHCALGHCGDYTQGSEESMSLSVILIEYYKHNGIQIPYARNFLLTDEIVYAINDGWGEFKKLGLTPKARILAALYDIKKLQSPSRPDIRHSLALSKSVEERLDESL